MSSELQRIEHRLLANLNQVSTVRPELEQQARRLQRLAADAQRMLDGSTKSGARELTAILGDAVAKCVSASQQLGAAKTAGERWVHRTGGLAKVIAVSAGAMVAGTLARVDGLEQVLAESVQIFEEQQEKLETGLIRAPDAAANSLTEFVRINLEISKPAQTFTSVGDAWVTPAEVPMNPVDGDPTGLMALVFLFVSLFPGKKRR